MRKTRKPTPCKKLPLLFKVLVGGKSCHGGSLTWSLPKKLKNGKYKPGKYHQTKSLRLCSFGLHLTTYPNRWWTNNAQVFVVEAAGALTEWENDKVATDKCRLLRPATTVELETLQIFTEGVHEVRAGTAIACGSSTVKAYESSTVKAYDSSTVKAYGSSTVMAYGSSTVMAYGSSTVMAYESSTVTAYGSSTVTAYESSTVKACGSLAGVVNRKVFGKVHFDSGN